VWLILVNYLIWKGKFKYTGLFAGYIFSYSHFAGPLKQAVDTIIEACVKGLESVKGIIYYVLTILIVIDVTANLKCP